MTPSALREIDLATWPRRAAFEYFRHFDKPYFNVCTRLDVAPLRAAMKAAGIRRGFSLACHFITMKLANSTEHEALRLRLSGGRVLVHPHLHGGATVLRDDGSFAFAYLAPADDFSTFAAHAEPVIAAASVPGAPFDPRLNDTAVIHYTTLPWVHFTSFSHARQWGREDSVPKIAFGRIDADGGGTGGRVSQWMPFSLEVHHALADGLHVGRYVQALEAALATPADWLR
jgi:chloramphenicol O-acetyltransferase type A